MNGIRSGKWLKQVSATNAGIKIRFPALTCGVNNGSGKNIPRNIAQGGKNPNRIK